MDPARRVDEERLRVLLWGSVCGTQEKQRRDYSSYQTPHLKSLPSKIIKNLCPEPRVDDKRQAYHHLVKSQLATAQRCRSDLTKK